MNPYNDTDSKKAQVRDMFNSIAHSYDRLNHLLSLGTDYAWRRRFVRHVLAPSPVRILDLATGTGDVAIMIARADSRAAITGIDLSEGMIEVARRKAAAAGLSERIGFAVGDGEALALSNESFDAVSVVFGVRNFQNLEEGLSEMFRVLQRGGHINIMEFSMPKGKIFGSLYRFYSKRVMPLVGGLISKDDAAYRYLPESIPEFAAKDFMGQLRKAGFEQCAEQRLTHGVAMIYTAIKP